VERNIRVPVKYYHYHILTFYVNLSLSAITWRRLLSYSADKKGIIVMLQVAGGNQRGGEFID